MNQIKDVEELNNKNENISVYIKTIQDKKEYYLNITISKKIFKYEEILTNNNIPLDIYFILHITPNFLDFYSLYYSYLKLQILVTILIHFEHYFFQAFLFQLH